MRIKQYVSVVLLSILPATSVLAASSYTANNLISHDPTITAIGIGKTINLKDVEITPVDINRKMWQIIFEFKNKNIPEGSYDLKASFKSFPYSQDACTVTVNKLGEITNITKNDRQQCVKQGSRQILISRGLSKK